MNALDDTTLNTRYLANTHAVENVSCELADYNMYAQDTALREAVLREGAGWADAELHQFGQLTGSAAYLEQGALKFDLIVMDEASQLRPEEALGAIARGSQLVVVGDPKQLPPTSFFDRMLDSGDDEEEDEAPAAISDSKTRLLQSRASMRRAKFAREGKRPCWRAAMIDSIAHAPTLRTAPSPKRMRRSPMTVNLKPD